MLKLSISEVNSRFSPEQLLAVMPEISEFHARLKALIAGVKIINACEGGLEIGDTLTSGVVLNLQGDLFETELEKHINMKSRQSQ
jgi:hypothetical protein